MCERLQQLLDEARTIGNEALVAALEIALSAAGCGVTANSGGGGSNQPPK